MIFLKYSHFILFLVLKFEKSATSQFDERHRVESEIFRIKEISDVLIEIPVCTELLSNRNFTKKYSRILKCDVYSPEFAQITPLVLFNILNECQHSKNIETTLFIIENLPTAGLAQLLISNLFKSKHKGGFTIFTIQKDVSLSQVFVTLFPTLVFFLKNTELKPPFIIDALEIQTSVQNTKDLIDKFLDKKFFDSETNVCYKDKIQRLLQTFIGSKFLIKVLNQSDIYTGLWFLHHVVFEKISTGEYGYRFILECYKQDNLRKYMILPIMSNIAKLSVNLHGSMLLRDIFLLNNQHATKQEYSSQDNYQKSFYTRLQPHLISLFFDPYGLNVVKALCKSSINMSDFFIEKCCESICKDFVSKLLNAKLSVELSEKVLDSIILNLEARCKTPAGLEIAVDCIMSDMEICDRLCQRISNIFLSYFNDEYSQMLVIFILKHLHTQMKSEEKNVNLKARACREMLFKSMLEHIPDLLQTKIGCQGLKCFILLNSDCRDDLYPVLRENFAQMSQDVNQHQIVRCLIHQYANEQTQVLSTSPDKIDEIFNLLEGSIPELCQNLYGHHIVLDFLNFNCKKMCNKIFLSIEHYLLDFIKNPIAAKIVAKILRTANIVCNEKSGHTHFKTEMSTILTSIVNIFRMNSPIELLNKECTVPICILLFVSDYSLDLQIDLLPHLDLIQSLPHAKMLYKMLSDFSEDIYN
ncbi:hypothetical protein M153_1550005744 [Pseudoloma neurophilia]|uniref:Uncharacterized protein n=1 Tax=Pseudoloma neurophilia TaxID=146866 RepID=A0A0R0LZZ7_9MICR|nr:hypothetical protein M153_1550005744 [Pseudoloma neurophilia]